MQLMNDSFLKASSSILFSIRKKNLVESSSLELLATVTAANLFHIWFTNMFISKYIYLPVHRCIDTVLLWNNTLEFMQEGNVASTSFKELFTK